MTGPGQYLPDPTEGITRVEDLPKPKRVTRSRNYRRRRCPHCGHSAYRNRTFTRTLHDLGDLAANQPRDLVITYSQHCCSRCGKYFNVDLSDLADPNSHYYYNEVLAQGIYAIIRWLLSGHLVNKGATEWMPNRLSN